MANARNQILNRNPKERCYLISIFENMGFNSETIIVKAQFQIYAFFYKNQ